MEADEKMKAIIEWQRFIGRKGGKSRSEAKRRAVRANAAKARQTRMENRRKGKVDAVPPSTDGQ